MCVYYCMYVCHQKNMYVLVLYVCIQSVCVCVQSNMSEEELAVMEDNPLSSHDFMTDLRTEFVDHLNALKALSAHGPV